MNLEPQNPDASAALAGRTSNENPAPPGKEFAFEVVRWLRNWGFRRIFPLALVLGFLGSISLENGPSTNQAYLILQYGMLWGGIGIVALSFAAYSVAVIMLCTRFGLATLYAAVLLVGACIWMFVEGYNEAASIYGNVLVNAAVFYAIYKDPTVGPVPKNR